MLEMMWICAEERCWRRRLEMELPGKRKRERSWLSFIDVVSGRNVGGWRDRGRCRGQQEMKTDDKLRRP